MKQCLCESAAAAAGRAAGAAGPRLGDEALDVLDALLEERDDFLQAGGGGGEERRIHSVAAP